MVRGTTPTVTLRIKDKYNINLNEALEIYFTVSQGHFSVTKTGDDVIVSEDGRSAGACLTQEESMELLDRQKAEAQINWTYHDINGVVKRGATIVKEFEVNKQLYRKVIE